MTYRRPGITVTQEFQNAVPALGAVTLPCVVVGPLYQLVAADALGTYAGSQQIYAYASLLGGAIVDLEETAEDEAYPDTKMPVSVSLKNVLLQILPETETGSVVGNIFSDLTTGIFADVLVGDIIEILPTLGVTIVAIQTNGACTMALPTRLTAGVAGQFANVKQGDTVEVTDGTNVNTGTFTVVAKPSPSVLVLSAAVNDGIGDSIDVEYTITGDRGVTNAGNYRIKTKTDSNNVVLESSVLDTPEAPLTYQVKRNYGTVELARVTSLPGNGFLAEASGITLPVGTSRRLIARCAMTSLRKCWSSPAPRALPRLLGRIRSPRPTRWCSASQS
jgi:hypothetical protein